MPKIDLYWSPGACARVPFIALEEIGVPFNLRVLNRYVGEHLTPEYRAVNPKCKVPALVVDGWALTENPAIQTFLARAYPEARLLPTADDRVAIEALSMMAWFASGLHPAVGRLRVPSATSDEEASFGRIRELARTELEKGFAILEERLRDREWLFGAWSVVDAYMLWLWFRATGSGMDSGPFPRCADHGWRNEQRPSVARVLDREEEEFAAMKEAGTVPASVPPHQVGRIPLAASDAATAR